MTDLNKTKSKSKVTRIYNYTVLGIYAFVLLAYIVFKLIICTSGINIYTKEYSYMDKHYLACNNQSTIFLISYSCYACFGYYDDCILLL